MIGPTHGLASLEGGCNFREVGAYRTRDGRRMRSGRMYRSGSMSYFTAGDETLVRQLGIRTLLDLRRADERLREPTRWTDRTDVRIIDGKHALDASAPFFLEGRQTSTAAEIRKAMLGIYENIPEALGERLRVTFDHLQSGNVALLVHCSAGKDRTGVAIALILTALGVEKTSVLEDYLSTSNPLQLEQFVVKHRGQLTARGDLTHPILSMPEEARRALLVADPDYLDAAFAKLERQWGSVDNYLEQCVGLQPRVLSRVREIMLV
jgi:protein-tyrosine phosphatase